MDDCVPGLLPSGKTDNQGPFGISAKVVGKQPFSLITEPSPYDSFMLHEKLIPSVIRKCEL